MAQLLLRRFPGRVDAPPSVSGPRKAEEPASARRHLWLPAGLTFRVTLAYLLFALVILVAVGVLAYDSGRGALEHATVSGLSAQALEKQARIADWFDEKASDVTVLAGSPAVLAELPALLRPGPAEREPTEAARERLNRHFSEVWLKADRKFLSIFLLDAETGRIVAGSHPADIGKFKEDRNYFREGKTRVYVQNPYYSVPEGGPSVVFSAPVRAADGRVLAVVAGRGRMEEIEAIIGHRPDERSTQDNFIVNTAGLFVTQPRFIADRASLRFGTQSPFVRRCLAGNNGITLTDDYRGVPVIAIYRWMAERQFCLVAKVDQAEALAPVVAFKNSMLLTGLATLVIASIIAAALARTITQPVRALQAGAARIGRGERDVNLPESDRDELGLLAREFNAMTRSLAGTEAELQRRADELQAMNQRLAGANASLERENAERIRAEGEVRTLNEELEKRVAARTAELETVNRELESFAYSVSHDLRAPLRHMDGFSQALLEDYGATLEDTAKQYLQRIRAGSVRMGRLIDDLLNLSRVTRGGIERDRVDLSAVAHAIVALLREREPGRSVAVKIAPNLSATGDPRLLHLALENLIGNAWKFTAKTPDARIEFGTSQEAGKRSFYVRDNGAGFDMAYAHKLFAPFQRLHSAAEFDGTGIGLATVARILHRHGGEVGIESAVGAGTTVRFTL